jgi:hypothetical protein
MMGLFAIAYSVCLGLLIWLTNQGVIPKISEKRYEILWALVLAPIFFIIYLVIYYFEKDET